MSKIVEDFWTAFLTTDSSVPAATQYQVWHFGNTQEMAIELAELVISCKKTATCALAAAHELKPEEKPIPNGYSVVTDFDNRPMCVIRTTEIRYIPFDEVGAAFAADEGEGDLSLGHWRNVHRRYFEKEAAEFGLSFDERSLICCERFELLFPK